MARTARIHDLPGRLFRGWRLLVLAFGVAAMLAAAPVHAEDTAAAETQAILDQWNETLTRLDEIIEAGDLPDPRLRDLRSQASQIASEAATLADTLGPRVEAAAKQVKELSPAEGSDEPLTEALQQNLDTAQKRYTELSGSQKQAQAISVHGAYTASQINEHRRRLFAGRLMERSASVLDPALWTDASAEAPRVAARVGGIVQGWFEVLERRGDRPAMALIVFVLVSMIVLILPVRRMVMRRLRLKTPGGERSHATRTKVMAAATIVLVNTLVPVGVLFGGRAVLAAFDLMPERVDQFWLDVTAAVTLISLGVGVARALLAPGRPDLRLVDIDETTARRVFGIAVVIASLQGIAVFIERFSRIAYTGLPLVISSAGILSTATGLLVILAVRILGRPAPVDEEKEEDGGSGGLFPGLGRLALLCAATLSAVAIVANLMGYVALGRFITTQVSWIAAVVSLFVLLTMLADELTAAWFQREGVVGSRLVADVGFAPRSLTQLGVLFNGFVRVVLIGLAFMLIAAPFGLDSGSIFESVRQLFFGFRIGSITVSISTIIAGLVVFGIGVVVTKALQNWLDTRFLPTTRLDSGLRNSIRTTIGYVGLIVAATIAFGYAGLDLSNIAIVAGALSVGIGLGLQSIVNNFVSGLILLAERPIRAGDWIAVGAEEGVVKRINVRATEIETFDRATVIVPNSSLISGVVKNMVLRDRSGRIVVPVTVAKTSDPDAVRAVLVQVAKAHPLVLAYPEPSVLFINFSAASLEFELRCYLSDISQGASVRSDLRYQSLARFREGGIALP